MGMIVGDKDSYNDEYFNENTERKLISMTAFVLEQNNKNSGKYKNEEASTLLFKLYKSIFDYANFLNQPLTLGMFVPTDLEGSVLTKENSFLSCNKGFEYGEAKERVLFEGFEIEKGELDRVTNGQVGFYPENFKTIEDLVKYNLNLTQQAINQIM